MLGVYDAGLTEPIANALRGLGIKSAMVVHGMDGLDEISLSSPTKISRLNDDAVSTTYFNPEHLGISKCDLEAVKGGTAKENAVHLLHVLEGKPGSRRDIALVNAAAALVVANRADDMADGLQLATESVDSGAAKQKLDEYLSFRSV